MNADVEWNYRASLHAPKIICEKKFARVVWSSNSNDIVEQLQNVIRPP